MIGAVTSTCESSSSVEEDEEEGGICRRRVWRYWS